MYSRKIKGVKMKRMEKVLHLLQSCHCWRQVSSKSIMTFSASRQSKTCWFRLVGEATRKYSCHRCWSWNWKEISLLIKKTVASSLRAGAARPVFISGAAHSPFSILDTHLVKLKTHSHLGKTSMKKKTFSFGHCPNHLTPPPLPLIRATWSFFRTSKFKIWKSLEDLREIN